MYRVVQLFDRTGAVVSSGVTVDSAFWQDGDGGSITAGVSVVSGPLGTWKVTVADPPTPRGPAGVVLAFDDGTGTSTIFKPMVTVEPDSTFPDNFGLLDINESGQVAASSVAESVVIGGADPESLPAAAFAGSAREAIDRLAGSKATYNTATGIRTFYNELGEISFTEGATVVGTTETRTRS